MALYDTHCHLDFESFDGDRHQVIQNARQAGIERIIVPGIDLSSSRRAVNLAETYPQVFAAVGVHPNDAAGWNSQTIQELRFLSRKPGVVAVGEIGLDYYRKYTPPEKQAEILQAQLELARELDLPVVLHCRQAAADLFEIVSAWAGSLDGQKHTIARRPGVLHAFDGSYEEALKWTGLAFFLGIGGPVTYQNAEERRVTLRKLQLEWIILETDAPFLAPTPHRGRRNQPAFIELIARAVADLKGLAMEDVARITGRNADDLFQWSR